MKPPLGTLLILTTGLLFFAGCDPDAQERPHQGRKPGGFATPPRREPAPSTGEDSVVDPTVPPEHHDRAPQSPDTAPPPKQSAPAPQVGNPEYGKAVPGKPGFVTSPYAPYQGYVDVRGYAPGTEVKDPYTGKIFLVPAQ